MHLYNIYPGMSPGLLTDLRSAYVNNDCYSLSAVKVGLQKHILHASAKLQEQIDSSVQNLDPLLMGSTFGWESENSLPKVLGDVIESIAGTVLVDFGYKKDIVFKSILPLLEPLVSSETLKLQPVRELHQLCRKENYVLKNPVVTCENGVSDVCLWLKKLTQVVEAERDSARDFQPLPFDYVEIARLLFYHAHASSVLVLFPKQ
ncbi:RNase III domain-containing protein [Heracleum sosnowskyi]|uniref:RNase III domain-containing protein n=1 Tax=Heracleum sosnowskyi TaxID=360622 RepID=A0AAD8IGY9_9APIA|nr:RNase III domain-containing protein [Heracleum sosnowskyi]